MHDKYANYPNYNRRIETGITMPQMRQSLFLRTRPPSWTVVLLMRPGQLADCVVHREWYRSAEAAGSGNAAASAGFNRTTSAPPVAGRFQTSPERLRRELSQEAAEEERTAAAAE